MDSTVSEAPSCRLGVFADVLNEWRDPHTDRGPELGAHASKPDPCSTAPFSGPSTCVGGSRTHSSQNRPDPPARVGLRTPASAPATPISREQPSHTDQSPIEALDVFSAARTPGVRECTSDYGPGVRPIIATT